MLGSVLMPVRMFRRALQVKFWKGFIAGAGLGYAAGVLLAARYYAQGGIGTPGPFTPKPHVPSETFQDCGAPGCPYCASFRAN